MKQAAKSKKSVIIKDLLKDIKVGDVFLNPQSGISTVFSIDNNSIKYTKGETRASLPIDAFSQVLGYFNGKKCSTSDLQKYLPSIFESSSPRKIKGYCSNCTFLFSLAVRLSLTDGDIMGSGQDEDPHYVVFKPFESVAFG